MSGPAGIEYEDLRLTRKHADDGMHVIVSVPGANGALDLTLSQLNHLVDGAAAILGRPDIILAHQQRPAKPAKRTTYTPAAAPRPAGLEKEEEL